MLFLRLNEGAVVEFKLIGSAEPIVIVGKIIKVFPDEVEICQQKRVHRNNRLDLFTSVDYPETLHIARHLIQSWKYAKVLDFPSDAKNIYLNHKHNCSIHTFTTYDKDGFCKGNGSYCGDIKLDSSPMLISIPLNNFDGMEMFLEQ